MPSYTTQEIRNIAFVGHGGSGKTSLIEAILHHAGTISQPGQVEKGNTVTDFTAEEKAHRHSLFTAAAHCQHEGCHINLLDTPGYPDFIGQAISALPAVETAAVVISAQAGIEPMARRMMQRAQDRQLCRMIVVNKIDAENIDLPSLLEQIQETFGPQCLPINLPADNASRVVDCFFGTQGQSDLGLVADFHTAIIEQVVEIDDKLMELYLEQGHVQPEQLHAPFERALREGHLIPICFTAARQHDHPEQAVGVDALLDMFVKLAPSPCEGNPRPFFKGHNQQAQPYVPTLEPDSPVVAHVFHVANDRFGKLSLFRVHQGTIKRDSQLFIGDARKPFKIGHLYAVRGKDHVEIESAIPGDIAAVLKIDEIRLHDVLHNSQDEDPIWLKPLDYPEPMQGLAITARKRGDEQKIADGLHHLAEEDPCFTVTRDPNTHETVIRGLGDLHLRVVLEMLRERSNVEVDTRPPKIAYRETITAKAQGHHRHKKQTGGAGQFGEVFMRIEPLQRGEGFEFSNDVVGGSIPGQFIPAVEKGVRQVLEEGAIAGYPLQDIRVSVYDGKHHPVDSKEVAFVAAGKRAFIDAIQKARPVILEPIVEVDITIPSDKLGDITGDLSSKRGRIQGTDMMAGDMATVRALVPLSEMTNYQSQLKSVTGGQGSYAMTLSHYEPVPPNIQQQIVSQYKPRAEED